jgi:transposase
MQKHRNKYDEEFKRNAVKLSYASPKSVKEIADDLGVGGNLLYNWRKKYTSSGEKTEAATLEEEVKKLRLENAELKIERDMLKKAAAYFAKHQK